MKIFMPEKLKKNSRSAAAAAVCAVLMAAALTLTGCDPLALDPDDSGAYEAGIKALMDSDYDEALKQLQDAADIDGRLAESCRAQGIVYLEKGDYKHAMQLLDYALEYLKVDNEAFVEDVKYYQAECFTRMNDPISAEALYESLMEGERPYLACAMLGSLHLKNGEETLAREYFDRAIADNPDYSIYLLIYEECAGAHLEADGTAYLEKALERVPETPEDHTNLGKIYARLQDNAKAKEEFQTAVDAGWSAAVAALGNLYLDEGNISAARSLYENEIRDGSAPADGYNGLALCEIAQGRADAALQYIAEGLRLGDEDLRRSLLFNEVVAYEALEQFETAKEKAEEFLKQYPNDPEMKREYQFLSL